MVNKILIKFDYILYRYSYLLPTKYMNKFSIPSKRLVHHCWKNWNNGHVKYMHEKIAHMYAFDSTILSTDLEFISNCYGVTRERIRQCLAKFIRMYYN